MKDHRFSPNFTPSSAPPSATKCLLERKESQLRREDEGELFVTMIPPSVVQ